VGLVPYTVNTPKIRLNRRWHNIITCSPKTNFNLPYIT
jgi:hypothetical protein